MGWVLVGEDLGFDGFIRRKGCERAGMVTERERDGFHRYDDGVKRKPPFFRKGAFPKGGRV